jgi:hypothetical protein
VKVDSGATLDVTALASGLTIGSGRSLSGEGTILGAITVDGNLNPGSSPGTLEFGDALSLTSTAVLTMEITGIMAGDYDVLLGDGANTLTFGGTLALDNTGYFNNAIEGQTITVFENWGSRLGTFASITGTDLGGGLGWDTSKLGIDGTLTVIPEPATWLLLTAGLTSLIVRRRRRTN